MNCTGGACACGESMRMPNAVYLKAEGCGYEQIPPGNVVEDLARVGVTQADWDAFVERANAAIKKHQYSKGAMCRLILPLSFPPPQLTATCILGVLDRF